MTPVFVFGVARSGTNLVARLLGGHSQVRVALDPLLPIFSNWIRDCALQFGSDELRDLYGRPGSIPDYYFCRFGRAMRLLLEEAAKDTLIPDAKQQMLHDALIGRAALEDPDLADSLQGLQFANYRELVEKLLSHLGREQTGSLKYAGVKEVWTIEFLPVLAQMFPAARFIVLHRDPRAIIASLLKMSQIDDSQLAHTVSYMRHWRKHVALSEEYLARDELRERILNISYEETAQAPEVFCGTLCKWLDLGFEETMLEITGSGWSGNSSYGDLAGVVNSSCEKWTTELTPNALECIEYLCECEMQRKGYELRTLAQLTDGVIAHMKWADENSGSWRSDEVDLYQTIAWEELRRKVIKGQLNAETDLIERLFLTRKLYSPEDII